MDEDGIFISTPAQIRAIFKTLIEEMGPKLKEPKPELSETMSMSMTISYLAEKGYPTSKSKIYQLTSRNEIPHHKYGSKLVFYRSEIDQWMRSQTRPKKKNKAEALNAIAESARRKLNPTCRKK